MFFSHVGGIVDNKSTNMLVGPAKALSDKQIDCY